MRNLKLLFVAVILIASAKSFGQISIGINIGTPPMWAPVGYERENYYYLPDVEAYYDVRESQFIYLNGGRWTRGRYLPGRYRNYDLYNGYKVVLTDYRGDRPYANFKSNKVKYYKGYRGAPQRTIGHRDNGNHYGNEKHENHGNGNEGRDNYGDDDDHGKNKRGKEGHGKEGRGKD